MLWFSLTAHWSMGSSSFASMLQTPETAHSEGTETEGNFFGNSNTILTCCENAIICFLYYTSRLKNNLKITLRSCEVSLLQFPPSLPLAVVSTQKRVRGKVMNTVLLLLRNDEGIQNGPQEEIRNMLSSPCLVLSLLLYLALVNQDPGKTEA